VKISKDEITPIQIFKNASFGILDESLIINRAASTIQLWFRRKMIDFYMN
jgi:hypothetical protein